MTASKRRMEMRDPDRVEYDAIEARINAALTAIILAEPVETRHIVGMVASYASIELRKHRPPITATSHLQIVPAEHAGPRPYWGE